MSSSIPSVFLQELEDFRAWQGNEPDFDMLDYAMCIATPDLLCMLVELADPPLTLYKGEKFLAYSFNPQVCDEWIQKLNDLRAVQRVMNHVHIASLIQESSISDQMAAYIAQRIAKLWSKVLSADGLTAVSYGSTLQDAQVTFYRDTQ